MDGRSRGRLLVTNLSALPSATIFVEKILRTRSPNYACSAGYAISSIAVSIVS